MSTDQTLAPREEPTDALDPYERAYMSDGQAVVMREKTQMNWKAQGFAAVGSLFVLVWSVTHGNVLLGLGLGVGLMLFSLLFAVLRVRVTTEHVHVQYGVMGPKIPLASIESVEAVEHQWTNVLRWGVSPVGRSQWLYSIAGDDGRAVKITWLKQGKRLVHYIGSPEHEELARAIEAARGPLALSSGDSV